MKVENLGIGQPWKKKTLTEDNHGRGQPWKKTTMEEDNHGRGQPWKTITVEENNHGSGKPWNRTTMEEDNHRRGQPWKETALITSSVLGVSGCMQVRTLGYTFARTHYSHHFTRTDLPVPDLTCD